MSFDSYGSATTDNTENKKEIDWDGLNKYVVETADLSQPETLIGNLVGIIDLGIQPQDDAEVLFNGTPEDEAAAIADKPATYFKDGKDDKGNDVRLKCWPQKAVQCVTFAVDFKDIIVDKGQFFGESTPLPLRLYYGGQFYTKNNGMICGRTINLKLNKKTGSWSLDPKNIFYKMAVDSKLINAGEPFLPQDIDKLIGKPFQFKAQVFFKAGKDGKQYYTEKLTYSSGLSRGQSAEDLSEDETFMVQFNQPNDDKSLKEVRAHIKNTMKMADNYDSSLIKSQLEGDSKPEPSKPVEEEKNTAVVEQSVPPVVEDFADDSPF